MQKRLFGSMPDGRVVEEYTLTNDGGCLLKILTYGGIVTQLHVPDRNGITADIVTGYNDLESYLTAKEFFGAITGRVAGRISNATFSLNSIKYPLAQNDPPNHLHGGRIGLNQRLWNASVVSDDHDNGSLLLTYHSPDGEEGYPGNVDFSVMYSLNDDNELIITQQAQTDQYTPISLTHHSYFNLAGEASGTIHNHTLQIYTDRYTPTDEKMTLLGCIEPVTSANDFTQPRQLAEVIPQLLNEHGDNYFIRHETLSIPQHIATLTDPSSGRCMEVLTTDACLQVYAGKYIQSKSPGKSGNLYTAHTGLCLECQGYPDGANQPQIHDIRIHPQTPYRQTTVYRFSAM